MEEYHYVLPFRIIDFLYHFQKVLEYLVPSHIPNPVLVIIDVQPKEMGVLTKAYYVVEEVKENATQKSQKVFVHMPSEIAAHDVQKLLFCCLIFLLSSVLFLIVTARLSIFKAFNCNNEGCQGCIDLHPQLHVFLKQSHWIGKKYYERGPNGNDIHKTNVPHIRLEFRDMIHHFLHFQRAEQKAKAIPRGSVVDVNENAVLMSSAFQEELGATIKD
ncbi:hypothetical protein ACSBR1_002347 [Camellia fascicularis]